MERNELLRRITALRLSSPLLAEELLAGEFSSGYRGQGIEFNEVRPYEIGDDVRRIDWNVSARFGKPYIKLYTEERELTLCLVLDCSASMHSGIGSADAASLNRYEQGLLASALLGFSAERKGQRVGAIFYDRDVRRTYSPRKGRAYLTAILLDALDLKEGGKGSNLGSAIRATGRLLKRRSLVAIISDFLSINWEIELGELCGTHDVLAIRISDPLDTDMPDAGLLTLEDRETGQQLYSPTSFRSFRGEWNRWHQERRELWEAICRRSGAAPVELSTLDDAPATLSRFFRSRRQR